MTICSLRGDVERLAFSVIWELDQQANQLSVRFTKSIIRSRAALTYEQAQNRIDGRDTDDVTTGLRLLMKVAKILRQRRYAHLQQSHAIVPQYGGCVVNEPRAGQASDYATLQSD